MIFVRDKGRMCNNILQYGHVYAWGREHGRRTVSMRFAYKYQYFNICDTRYHSAAVYLLAKLGAQLGLMPVVGFHDREPDTAALEAQMLQHHTVMVEGWWVPWHDLFLKYKQEIIRLFGFKDNVRQGVDRLMAQQPPCGLRIGLHIRRGDYRTWHNGRYYYSDAQYINVVKGYLEGRGDKDGQQHTLYICGNDPDTDEASFRAAFPDCTVVMPKGNPGEDLYLLSQCDRLIGAPSSFTLVAAMYHDTPLYWIEDPTHQLREQDFGHFDRLFTQMK